MLNDVLSGVTDSFALDAKLSVRDRWLNVEGSRVLLEGESRIIGNVRDITDRKKSELSTKQNEARLKRAQQVARVWEFHWDLVKDRITWSDSISSILNAEPPMETLTFDHFMATLREEDREAFKVATHNTIHHGIPGEVEYVQTFYNGAKVQVVSRWEVAARNDANKVIAIAGVTQDVSSLRAAQERVSYKERFHRCSGLPNKQVAFDRLAYLLGGLESEHDHFGIVGIKVAGYKQLRDAVPATTFYEALKNATNLNRRAIRDLDLIARLDHGHFVVIIRKALHPALNDAVAKIRASWSAEFGRLTPAIGFAIRTTCVVVPEDSKDFDGVVALITHRLANLQHESQ
jgi:PAS domain-containing protein/GGDEF domain-containing protein